MDIRLDEPPRVLELAEEPVLARGPLGHFDDNGVYPGAVLAAESSLWMYYAGRNNGEPPLYYMSVGLAESRDGGRSFSRVYPSPVLGRGVHDPWMVSTPWVLRDGATWRMWYLSGIDWISHEISRYHIKYAESDDGVNWRREGRVAIALAANETNIASPCVLRGRDGYCMWYCHAELGRGYRLGFARSDDGLEWVRRDEELRFTGRQEAWDADSMAYPSVFVHEGGRYLIYSGNGNGREGIGIAIEE